MKKIADKSFKKAENIRASKITQKDKVIERYEE
jgi:hypothetical protein